MPISIAVRSVKEVEVCLLKTQTQQIHWDIVQYKHYNALDRFSLPTWKKYAHTYLLALMFEVIPLLSMRAREYQQSRKTKQHSLNNHQFCVPWVPKYSRSKCKGPAYALCVNVLEQKDTRNKNLYNSWTCNS